MRKSSLALGIIALLQLACSQQEGDCAKPAEEQDTRYPNKSSELALLMRSMKEKSFDWKEAIETHAVTPENLYEEFSKIHSAVPTDAAVKGPVFESFAGAYLGTLKAAVEATDTNRIQSFNVMVDACMNCHSEFCPGPMKVIKKLYLPAPTAQ